MPNSAIISFDRFSLTLGEKRVLSEISFAIKQGERVVLLGESGSGKSMTARAALGLLPSNAEITGSVRLAGQEITHISVLSRTSTMRPAMIMQDTQAALNPLATIAYQLEQPLRHSGLSRHDARATALDLLHQVGLPAPEEMARRCSAELSGGQRQRVCIAMALAAKARVIIADEPTSALDVVTQAQILKLLRSVCETPGGPALLFITHDLHAAAHLCERAIIIEAGQIVETGPMAHILSHPNHARTQSLIASALNCGIACERLYA